MSLVTHINYFILSCYLLFQQTTWDPNTDQVTFTSEAFYNRDDVKAALHAPTNITWHGCRWGAGRRGRRQLSESSSRRLYMDYDHPIDMRAYMADVLDAGIPFLICECKVADFVVSVSCMCFSKLLSHSRIRSLCFSHN